jgi:hypothetical protein
LRKLLLYITITAIIVLSACSGADKGDFVELENGSNRSEEEKPVLKAEVKVDGSNALVYVDTDLHISEEEYGKEKKKGQGHIHIYVDNGEKQGVTNTPIQLENLSQGSHKVKISLHNNDHTPYDVTETIDFTIK